MAQLPDPRLLRRAVALFAIGLLPLLLLAAVAAERSTAAVERRVDHELSATARLASDAVAAKVIGLRQSVASFAQRPGLRAAVAGEVTAGTLAVHLDQLRESHAGVVATWLVDASGRVIETAPHNENLANDDFAHRDWFKGAQRSQQAFVGEAIVGAATGDAIIPIAAPVRSLNSDGSSELGGYLGLGFSVDAMQELSDSLAGNENLHLRVVDAQGHRLAGPTSTTDLSSLLDDPAVAAALDGETGLLDVDRGSYTDRVAFGPIPELGWAVTMDMSHELAYAPARQLERQISLLALVVIVLAFLGCAGVLRMEARRLRVERELARQARALEAANAALSRSNEELAQFAHVASHDLAEPLRAISGFVQLLADRYQGRLDEQADRYIGHVITGTTRMRTLIDDLLAVSRVVNNPMERVVVDLNQVVSATLDDLEAVITETNATVITGVLPRVAGETGLLRQVFQNLISNSIKFRRPGVDPEVRIHAGHHDDGWLISVTDNGIGIEAAYRERVFRMFQRLHGRSEYPGTGIGLALVKRIVERHDGTIWIEDGEGGGCRVNFTLPAAATTRTVGAAVEPTEEVAV